MICINSISTVTCGVKLQSWGASLLLTLVLSIKVKRRLDPQPFFEKEPNCIQIITGLK